MKPASDGTMLLQVDWNALTSENFWNMLTNAQYGRQTGAGMTLFVRHAIKMIKVCEGVPPASSGFLAAIVATGNTKSLNSFEKNVQLKEHFLAACNIARTHVMQKMKEYCTGHPIYVHKRVARQSDCTSPPQLLRSSRLLVLLQPCRKTYCLTTLTSTALLVWWWSCLSLLHKRSGEPWRTKRATARAVMMQRKVYAPETCNLRNCY